MKLSNILVAYDGSVLSEKALRHAADYAKDFPECKLEVVHVLKFPNVVLGQAYMTTTPGMKEAIYEEAEAVVKRAEKILQSLDVSHRVTMLEGNPAAEIVQYAKRAGSQLIVIGSRGLSGLKKLMLGSVSHHVVQLSDIPVLVVK
ncbi:MAG TPA: universal stress protein [Bacilli bacterium]